VGRRNAPDNQIIKALRRVKDLSKTSRRAIADLGLNAFESLVVGYLKQAYVLLIRDPSLDMHRRQRMWHNWQRSIKMALDDALRYRHNENLVMLVGVTAALFPTLDLRASLLAYKTLNEAALFAERRGTTYKRERSAQFRRIKDRIYRVGVYVSRDGQVIPSDNLSVVDRSALTEKGYLECSGITFTADDPEGIIRLVEVVIPVVWNSEGSRVTLTSGWL
jgi:hypothetical protein